MIIRRTTMLPRRRPSSMLAVLAGVIGLTSFLPVLGSTAGAGTTTTELGVNVLMYPEFGTRQQNLDAAKKMFTYVRSLHANAVALCFNVYPIVTSPDQTVVTTSTVGPGEATPSPAFLGEVADLAHAAGLTVQLRPLLNEAALKSPSIASWRGAIAPADPAAWFASYTRTLTPFMRIARLHSVEGFVVGAELTSMVKHNRYWLPLINLARRLTGTAVSYEGNWNPRESLPGANFGLEFYQPLKGITDLSQATVANFTAGMEANLSSTNFGALPVPLSQVTLSEVAVGARDQGWLKPWQASPSDAIVRSVQANWFTAACNAVRDLGLKGIYFWSLLLNSSFSPTQSDDPVGGVGGDGGDGYHWQNTASSDAISSCFSSLS